MRARAKGSLFTKWTDGEGSETGAGASGGEQPQQDGPDRSENGDCDTVGAMSCGAPAGAGMSVEEPAGREEARAEPGSRGVRVQRGQGSLSGGLEHQPTSSGLRELLWPWFMLSRRRACRRVQASGLRAQQRRRATGYPGKHKNQHRLAP